MRDQRIISWACLLAFAALGAALTPAAADEDASLFNTTMYEDPAKGEAPSKGEYRVVHKGEGKPPAKGYFKKHEPGEIAEYHVFVPEKLDAKKRYPLLIVYHGGKDGGSGKGLCRSMARLSTKKHPVIVLSPNMYTLDAYNEILKAGELPVDPGRVVVFGFSSGGMGVRAAMVESLRTKGAFLPAALVSASTTASLGRVSYPQVPYIVMAGEKETPQHMKHPLLKTRRSTCRAHALMMQQVIREVRYIEMRGHGHTSGKPEHVGVLRNLLRGLPAAGVELKMPKVPAGLESLVESIRRGRWQRVQKELARLDEDDAWKSKVAYKTLRTRAYKALEKWFEQQIQLISRVGTKSKTWEILRAFRTYDQLQSAAIAFESTPIEDALYAIFDRLEKAKRWQRELAAREAYYKIAAEAPSAAMAAELQALRKNMGDTEFGAHRTREKLLALER